MNEALILRKIKRALKKSNSTNLFAIAEANNIVVLEYALGSMGGFYIYQKKSKIILLNSNLSDLHKQMVLAHEIGHALLHTKVNCAFIKTNTHLKHKIYEKEANFFGAHMLKSIGYLDQEDFCIHSVDVRAEDVDFITALIDVDDLHC